MMVQISPQKAASSVMAIKEVDDKIRHILSQQNGLDKTIVFHNCYMNPVSSISAHFFLLNWIIIALNR